MIDYVTREQFDVFLREEAEHHTKDEAYMRSIEVSVAAVGQQVAGVGVQYAAAQKQLEQHHKTIYGNGEPGMDEQIRRIVDYIDRQEKKDQKDEEEKKELAKEKRDTQQYWIRFIITTTIANIIVVVSSAILWLFKILPVLNSLQK